MTIRDHGVKLDEPSRDYMRTRVGFKLGKYALFLTRITVRIEDIAGPTGAPAYTCRFTVVSPKRPPVVVAATDSTPRSAFDRCADATERAVRRLLGRSRVPRG